ncbi:serine hydrolase domain-containing protein [Ramlibacter albus]|uniref:Beta-lactamase family protein n=1 Tax=Ramlibacter albus TaxID=2079448 RepID=A0A923M914_9BURK|nr:serine hydrolase domain-containing protein [Ramlibacter albus]MBC5766245.1 beta-lactamase family protein [Ramlibacter albus]
MHARTLVALGLIAAAHAVHGADPLPRATPESVGMSGPRLERIDARMKAEIAAQRIPGSVVAIARKGKLVYFKAFGMRDPATGAPMTTDAIFNIASMTKPMVAIATLVLLEEDRLLLGEPVGRYLPELGKLAVAKDRVNEPAGENFETVPLKRPVTVQDLMRHTAGMMYGGRFASTALGRRTPPPIVPFSSAELVQKMAALPLAHQPGTVWEYSISYDVLGALLERVSGKPLGELLREKVFAPLRMADTSFTVPADKANRYALWLTVDADTRQPQAMTYDARKPHPIECGGSCGISTAGDYLRFAQMLLNRGTLEGARILGPKLVDYMTADHLGPEIENRITSAEPHRDGYGYGLGVGVRRSAGVASTVGSAGDWFWNAGSGPSFWVDPKEELVVVTMFHHPGSYPLRGQLRQAMAALVYQAIDR